MIKSTLQSLPVYYMGTAKILTRITKVLTDLMRRFFWELDQKRYLAYVAWDKIAKPVLEGGLGIRDLNSLNDALLMKYLFQVAAGENLPWVQIVKAKYLPQSCLWASKREYQCTYFWRSIMRLRDKLILMIQWKIGDRLLCNAIREPWCLAAISIQLENAIQRRMKVVELVNPQNLLWDAEKLIQLFGYANSVQIMAHLKPPTRDSGPDSLSRFHK